jgi:hypothetical protein
MTWVANCREDGFAKISDKVQIAVIFMGITYSHVATTNRSGSPFNLKIMLSVDGGILPLFPVL